MKANKKVECKFCGLEIPKDEVDDFIGVCEFCFKQVLQEEKEYYASR